MKRMVSLLSVLALVASISFSIPSSVDAKVKVFKNCTELNKTYKGGVAKSKTVKNRGGKTKYSPYVSSSLYTANKKMDRDKDGITCEK